eukprot:jgi/Phyca11/5479/fgenesh1_pm.PHYCAscaffold_5_\
MEMPENQDSFPTKYWGNMTDHAPCCTSIKYAVLNTVNHSWTENSQLQKVCDRALAGSPQWPSLHLKFSIKRTGSEVHGQSKFSVLAAPLVSIDNSSVLYDTFTAFAEDEMLYNYTLVDGVGYVSRSFLNGTDDNPLVKCMDTNILPPVNSIAAALSDAKAVSNILSSDGSIIQCASGNSFKISVNDIEFGLCFFGSSGFTLYGTDLDIQVEYVERMLIQAPKLIPAKEVENLDSYGYWGNMTGHTPCCSSTKYAVLNTVNNSWTDDLLQQKVCDHILEVSETSTGTTISDTIIVSHSMGGLMIAGAIANGRCKLNNSTTWVSTGSPMTGSMASNYFQESCNDRTIFIMERFAETTGFCPADDGIRSLAYQRGNYSTAKLDEAYDAAQKAYRDNVYAVMCSRSYSGILSSYQYGFWIMGTLISHKSRKNDGMVEFHSCSGGFPASKFGKSYRDRFYASKLNHYDVAFKSGDALLDKGKMPVKWFECLL